MEITVFLPCFNCGEKISQTFYKINQVLTEEQVKFKCIINDDASTDETKEEIIKIIKKNEGLEIQHEENSINEGLGASLKKAINLSSGNYFMWIPGDDDISLDAIRKLVQSRKLADMGTFYIVNRDKRGLLRNVISSIYNFIHMIAFREYLLYVTSPGIYNNNILRTIKLNSKRFGIISELNIKMYFKSSSVIQIPLFIENGIDGSNSIRLINIFESIKCFFILILEYYFFKSIRNNNSIRFIKI